MPRWHHSHGATLPHNRTNNWFPIRASGKFPRLAGVDLDNGVGILRPVAALVILLCLFVVIYGGPILRLKFGWSLLVISAIQLACGALALYLVGREAYGQASKGEGPGSKPKLVNIVGIGVLVVALGAATLLGRRAP